MLFPSSIGIFTETLIVSFLCALVATPVMMWVARTFDWLAWPQDDRWHERPVALMGGVAVYAAFTAGILYSDLSVINWMWGGATLLFVTGLLDDRLDIHPMLKLLAQVAATTFLLIGGYSFGADWPFWLSIPITFFWVIGITNSINLLDNMDGLSPGVAAIAAGFIAYLSYSVAHTTPALIALALAGALAGFLVFNFNPAKIFMGDVGSLFVGYTLASLPLMLESTLITANSAIYLTILVGLFIVPIFDTTLVTLNRIFKGRSVAAGGKDHSSHRLVFLGLSERQSVLVLYGIAALFASLAVISITVSTALYFMLFSVAVLFLSIFGMYISRINPYPAGEHRDLFDFSRLPVSVKRRLQYVGAAVDIVLVVSSFTLAHYMRFEAWSSSLEQAMVDVLPGITVISLLGFYVGGLYRGIWQQAGTPEFIRIGITTLGVTAASLLFVSLMPVSVISYSAFVIFWMLLFVSVAGMRFMFKGLRRIFTYYRKNGKNVLIYGAGDAGWLALSEIRQNEDLNYQPVGFIDDSPFKQDNVIQGLKVLGSGDALDYLCYRYDVDEVLISISDLSDQDLLRLRDRCKQNDVRCKVFRPSFTDVDHTVSNGQPVNRELNRELVHN